MDNLDAVQPTDIVPETTSDAVVQESFDLVADRSNRQPTYNHDVRKLLAKNQRFKEYAIEKKNGCFGISQEAEIIRNAFLCIF